MPMRPSRDSACAQPESASRSSRHSRRGPPQLQVPLVARPRKTQSSMELAVFEDSGLPETSWRDFRSSG